MGFTYWIIDTITRSTGTRRTVLFTQSLIVGSLAVIIWYNQAKYLVPKIVNLHLKTYWRGKTIFIDKTEKENQVNAFRFYLRFFQVLFALLGVNTFISLFLVRPASGTTLPFVPIIIIMLFLGIFIPVSWFLEDIGLLVYNPGNQTIISSNKVINLIISLLFSVGPLVGGLLSAIFQNSTDSEVGTILGLVSSSVFYSSLIISIFFVLFFQMKPILSDWDEFGIYQGNTEVKFS